MKKQGKISHKFLCLLLVGVFAVGILSSDLLRVKNTQAALLGLPEPSQMLEAGNMYELPVLRGIRLDPVNPLNISFIVEKRVSSLV